jgi:acetamidase/formamidase
MDTKHIVKGSKLYLPIQVKGALFSLGDGHAAQGDGECCGNHMLCYSTLYSLFC